MSAGCRQAAGFGDVGVSLVDIDDSSPLLNLSSWCARTPLKKSSVIADWSGILCYGEGRDCCGYLFVLG